MVNDVCGLDAVTGNMTGVLPEKLDEFYIETLDKGRVEIFCTELAIEAQIATCEQAGKSHTSFEYNQDDLLAKASHVRLDMNGKCV